MSPPRRLQSQTERDFEGLAAKREREAAPVLVPEEDDYTGRYEGEELAEMRSQRSIDRRVGKLETKHDDLVEKVGAMHGDLREMRGEFRQAMTTLNATLTEGAKTQRTRISTNGKIIIAIVGAAITMIGTVIAAVMS
jgi:hypothetical protein